MWLLFGLLGIMLSCNTSNSEKQPAAITDSSEINLDHFNHLYKEIEIDGEAMGIVHIYSEYPDYVYEIEPKEGYTCVDDVARAVVMLAEYYKTGIDIEETVHKIKMMTKFILHMQNENGYFNNFIWNDLTINTTYKTTVAELNWWSLRAFWALETTLPLVKDDTELTSKIETAISRLAVNIKNELGGPEFPVDTVNTLEVPAWLPNKYAADQAAVLILGLLPYYERTKDEKALFLIDKMAKGLMQMQRGHATQYPYGAFMSWTNLWHAWGNNQAYAMLKAGRQLNNKAYVNSGLKEVDHFYPYLLKNGFRSAFWIEEKDGGFIETKREEFSRIAYGIRPMVWASVEAYEITQRPEILELSKELESWFFGNNIAKIKMYDEATGRGYDGIISPESINKNAGAESTLECLMTLLKTK
jgi:hypothetical protein